MLVLNFFFFNFNLVFIYIYIYILVILDCTLDTSHQEQMSLILRCVDISTSPIKIVEHFFEFVKVDDTPGKGLFDEIINVLNILELDINDIHGQ